MPHYEYLVIPAPEKGQRAKGVRGVRARFAHALQSVMNEKGREGWRYLRTDTLPCEERQGLTRRGTTFQNMLVFSRELPYEAPQASPFAPATPDPIDGPHGTISPDQTDLPEDVETMAGDLPLDGAEEEEATGVFQSRAASLGGVTRGSDRVDQTD